jgi:hypothetical protein
LHPLAEQVMDVKDSALCQGLLVTGPSLSAAPAPSYFPEPKASRWLPSPSPIPLNANAIHHFFIELVHVMSSSFIYLGTFPSLHPWTVINLVCI